MKRWLLTLALAGSGCGDAAALWVRVDAPFTVPGDCDALAVTVQRGGDAGTVIYQRTFDLTPTAGFPETLSLGTTDSADLGDGGLWVSATAYKGQTLARPWATASGAAVLESGKTAEVDLEICDCPGGP